MNSQSWRSKKKKKKKKISASMTRRTRSLLLALFVSVLCTFTLLHLAANQKMIPENSPGKRKIIILTYMRSGSSLTGDILQQNRNVFYVFEPLWTTEKFFLGYLQPSTYRLMDNSTLSVPRTQKELTMRYNQVLDSFLNCRLEEIDVVTLSQYFMNRSISTKDFYTCVQDSNMTRIHLCIQPLVTTCQRSRVIVIKIIRSRLEDISSMFASDPKINIIHLVRDPRGALMSQRRVGVFEWNGTKTAANDLCQRIANDVSFSRKLSEMSPKRILTVRYEDIAAYPLEAARTMYRFINLETSADLEKYVWNITYGGYPDGCAVCINRSNATKTANRWRRILSSRIVNTIQQECGHVFEIMGYRTFTSSEEMRNLTLSAELSSYSEDLFKVQPGNR